MSKYNLTDILNEYIGGGRIGTLKISYKDLQDKMDELERSGKVIVREIPGPSGDLKVNREFEVVDRDSAVAGGNKQERGFTVYDYKFGFDPGSQEHFDEEYDFSIGGNNKKNALILARDLLGPAVKGYFGDDQKIVNSYTPQMANDVIMSLDRNMDDEGEMTDYAADVEIDNMEINEENVIKDLAQADEVIKIIKMMNPDVREDLLKRIARMGQKLNEGDLFSSKFDRQELKAIINDLNKGLILDMPTRRAYKFLVSLLDKEDKEEMGLDEQMYIDDDEFNKEMGRSKKDALRQEMMFHVNQLMDGNIDKNDFMNVVEDIMMDLGLKEVMGVDRKGRKKPESKSNMTKVNEASQEESVATYIQDYYRNPKTGESMISDEMVDEFYKTHPEWEDQADGTKEGMKAVLDNFNEFFEINYGIMFDDSRDIDENLKKHFKRFM